MIPEERFSTEPVKESFLPAYLLPTSKELDYEYGGIAFQDTSEGLMHHIWRGRIINARTSESHVLIDAPGTPSQEVLRHPYISEMSFSFDSNMKQVVAFSTFQEPPGGGEPITESYIYWYDATIQSLALINLGTGVSSPKVRFDDRRTLASDGLSLSDTIVLYVKNDSLYLRYIRSRFTEEVLVAEDINFLLQAGFTVGNRFKIETSRFFNRCPRDKHPERIKERKRYCEIWAEQQQP